VYLLLFEEGNKRWDPARRGREFEDWSQRAPNPLLFGAICRFAAYSNPVIHLCLPLCLDREEDFHAERA